MKAAVQKAIKEKIADDKANSDSLSDTNTNHEEEAEMNGSN